MTRFGRRRGGRHRLGKTPIRRRLRARQWQRATRVASIDGKLPPALSPSSRRTLLASLPQAPPVLPRFTALT